MVEGQRAVGIKGDAIPGVLVELAAAYRQSPGISLEPGPVPNPVEEPVAIRFGVSNIQIVIGCDVQAVAAVLHQHVISTSIVGKGSIPACPANAVLGVPGSRD